ncbi:AAA family ATPase [Methylobacterium oryzisoli]|uniref:AAA family ATPase n=1 Tax=Methylobacterium oryzisoli TaxID=3385502 RepID=UPI003891AA7C
MTLNPKAVEFLRRRAIDAETADRLQLYTARRDPAGGDPVPDPGGDILVFPYLEQGEEVNAKYRVRAADGSKRFWQRSGARKTFFNADILSDPALEAGTPLVITEGELDTAAVIQAGHPFAVSVPDGAPPPVAGAAEVPDEAIVPEHDDKYRFIYNNWDRLKRVKRFVLAADGDAPGVRLTSELARRLNRARCAVVVYPPDAVVPQADGQMRPCKDLNEVLQYLGDAAVIEAIARAKPYPVKGLYKLSDVPEAPPIEPVETGLPQLDEHMKLYRGAFVVMSGLPGGGKTALTLQLAANTAFMHGWKWVIASFEMPIRPVIENMLIGFLLRRPRADWTRADCDRCREFIDKHFTFIALDAEDDDTEANLDWVLDRAGDAVVRHGADGFLLDPWNEVEVMRRPGENIADYTNRAIRRLKRFAKVFDVCTIVVPHPTKDAALSVSNGVPMSLYSIADGATWANKAEIGAIVNRESANSTVSTVLVKKVKFHETGKVGEVSLNFDTDLRMFLPQPPRAGSEV